MLITQEQYEQIVSFLEGKMHNEEEIAFIQLLSGNADLQKVFEEELLLRNITADQSKQAKALPLQLNDLDASDEHLIKMRQLLQEEMKKNDKKQNIIVWMKQKRIPLAIAAVLLGVILSIAMYVYLIADREESADSARNKKMPDTLRHKQDTGIFSVVTISGKDSIPDIQKIASELYEKYKLEDADDPPILDIVISRYRESKYDIALAESWGDFSTLGVDEDEKKQLNYLHFYRGLCFMELNQKDSAIYYLQRTVDSSTSGQTVHSKALWYLTILHLKNGNKQSAVDILLQLNKKGNTTRYRLKAANTLKRLNVKT
jgi:hypothetical protein